MQAKGDREWEAERKLESPWNPSVSVTRCLNYNRDAVYSAVNECVENLGGFENFISRGDTVLLKPNMLSARAPDNAVTTHPELVRAAIRLVREAGGFPVVGDTPSGITSESILENLAEKTGIGRVCEEEDVKFWLLLDAEKVPFPSGKVAKSFELAKALKEVDGIISLPKFKTHTYTGLTGAVKNLFGLIPGLRKADYHFRMRTAEAFSELLVDLAQCVKPRLTIMDGVIGMEGEGPSAGKPRHMGLIIASASPHALDAYMQEIVGAVPGSVQTVSIARERGLIPQNARDITVLGGDRASHRIEGFKMPKGPRPYGRIPMALGRLLGEGVARKPVFSKSKCTMCGLCLEVCPAKALAKDTVRPKIDRGTCIRCYCCQEICMSNAIMLKRIPGRSIYGAMSRKTIRLLRRT